ncbi:hypothetical protein DASC09_057280 [Saccharomycopsis crataegensis]|uniref:U1 small nuclear ribonucleoprotein component SNU71 n=1 Tax=Saccharomycopsis crataegensis TaxID=43959 RepID=A0AAV5QUD0_9ASCO|nr:hypothetical protein DASC09_057280 [Saccharomycopsis crataegensis]
MSYSKPDSNNGEAHKLVNITPEYFVNRHDIESIIPSIRQIADFSTLKEDSIKEIMNEKVFNFIPGTIPVILDAKANDFISKLKSERNRFKRQKTINNANPKSKDDDHDDDNKMEIDSDDNTDDSGIKRKVESKEKNLIELQQFANSIRSNLNEQILTVSISKFPNYSNVIIEKLLKKIIQEFLIDEFIQKYKDTQYNISYKWTVSNFENLENKIIYVKFEFSPKKSSSEKSIINEGFVNLNQDRDIKKSFLLHVFLKFISIMQGLKLENHVRDEYNRNRSFTTSLQVSCERNTDKLIKMITNEGDKSPVAKDNEDKKEDDHEDDQEDDTGNNKEDNSSNEDDDQKISEQQKEAEESIESSISKAISASEFEGTVQFQQELHNYTNDLIKHSRQEVKDDGEDSDSDEKYKVNLKELADLPKTMVPQIVEDIKNFRLGIIRIEKKKQAKKLLEEKKRSKAQIKKMYMSIRESRKKDGRGDLMDIDDDEDDDENDNEHEEMISDTEYENMKEDEQQEKIEKEFLRQEAHLKYLEQQTKAKLVATLNDLQNYAADLEQNLQKKYLDDYDVIFGDEDSEQPNLDVSKVQNSELIKTIESYNLNHSTYIHKRNISRMAEEKQDKAERKEEEKREKSQQEAGDFLNSVLGSNVQENAKQAALFKLNIKVSKEEKSAENTTMHNEGISKLEEPEDEDMTEENSASDPVYLKAGDKLPDIVKGMVPFMNDLLVEYLGMTEEELTGFLTNAIIEKESKESISEEVSNFLDDDTEAFMEKLWCKLEEESNKV